MGVCAVCLRIQFIVETLMIYGDRRLGLLCLACVLFFFFFFLIPSKVRQSCCSSCFDGFHLVYGTFLAVKRWVLKRIIKTIFFKFRASLLAQVVKNHPGMRETWVRSLGRGDPPGEGNGDPLQYPCLENSMGRGAWHVTVHGIHGLCGSHAAVLVLIVSVWFMGLFLAVKRWILKIIFKISVWPVLGLHGCLWLLT